MLWKNGAGGGGGGISSIAVATENGLAGTVTGGASAVIHLSTTVPNTQILYSDGTAIKGSSTLTYIDSTQTLTIKGLSNNNSHIFDTVDPGGQGGGRIRLYSIFSSTVPTVTIDANSQGYIQLNAVNILNNGSLTDFTHLVSQAGSFHTNTLPDNSGFLTLSVNGIAADLSGNITLPMTATLTSTQIGYGDGSNNLTGDANWIRNSNGIQLVDNNTNGNIFFGGAIASGNGSTTGGNNIGIGGATINGLTSGNSNIAIGTSSNGASSGSSNIAIGQIALATNLTGDANVAIGQGADVTTDGISNSIALGNGAIAFKNAQFKVGGAGLRDMFLNLNAYPNDAAAGLAGLTTGEWYQQTGTGAVFIKQ